MSNIPEAIIKAGDYPADEVKNIEYLGKYKGDDVYCYSIPNMITGFPVVYLISRQGKVRTVLGHDALDIVSIFYKD